MLQERGTLLVLVALSERDQRQARVLSEHLSIRLGSDVVVESKCLASLSCQAGDAASEGPC